MSLICRKIYIRYNGITMSFAEMVAGEKGNDINLGYELDLYETILKCCGGLAGRKEHNYESNTCK